MSIAPNVGSIASYLSVLRTKPLVELRAREGQGRLRPRAVRRHGAQGALDRRDGRRCASSRRETRPRSSSKRWASATSARSTATTTTRCSTRSNARKIVDGPVLLHVRTVKGKGFRAGRERLRARSTASVLRRRERQARGEAARRPTFSQAFADALIELARTRPTRHRHHRRHARRHEALEVRQGVSRRATSTSASPKRTRCASRPARRPAA